MVLLIWVTCVAVLATTPAVAGVWMVDPPERPPQVSVRSFDERVAPPNHPVRNVVVILLDDATTFDTDEMPQTQRLIADEGITFERNYSPFPVCCSAEQPS